MIIHARKHSGVLFVTILAIISYLMAMLPWLMEAGISSLIVAIILGIFIGNSWHYPDTFIQGIQFSAKRLLRLGIILYGFRVTFQQIADLGIEIFIIDIFVVLSTLFVGFMLGRKLLGLDKETSLLISIGAAICGAAAVLAMEEVIKSEPYKATIAIGTVVLFGTFAMFLYPILQRSGFFGLTSHQYSIFTGASIHEVAQALVAGSHEGAEAGNIAVIVKMLRVLLLVPVLFIFSIFNKYQSPHSQKGKLSIPLFAIGFILMIGVNSLSILPMKAVSLLTQLDIILLTMAMAAIGLETRLSKIYQVGLKPIYLSSLLFLWLVSSVGLLITKWY